MHNLQIWVTFFVLLIESSFKFYKQLKNIESVLRLDFSFAAE